MWTTYEEMKSIVEVMLFYQQNFYINLPSRYSKVDETFLIFETWKLERWVSILSKFARNQGTDIGNPNWPKWFVLANCHSQCAERITKKWKSHQQDLCREREYASKVPNTVPVPLIAAATILKLIFCASDYRIKANKKFWIIRTA